MWHVQSFNYAVSWPLVQFSWGQAGTWRSWNGGITGLNWSITCGKMLLGLPFWVWWPVPGTGIGKKTHHVCTHRICRTWFRHTFCENLLERTWAQIKIFLSRFQVCLICATKIILCISSIWVFFVYSPCKRRKQVRLDQNYFKSTQN